MDSITSDRGASLARQASLWDSKVWRGKSLSDAVYESLSRVFDASVIMFLPRTLFKYHHVLAKLTGL